MMQEGDRVRVRTNVVVYNHPNHRGEAFDLMGEQGEIRQILKAWKGRPISPTLPIVVIFDKFRAHFSPDELEVF